MLLPFRLLRPLRLLRLPLLLLNFPNRLLPLRPFLSVDFLRLFPARQRPVLLLKIREHPFLVLVQLLLLLEKLLDIYFLQLLN